jgi:hypothetical protein
MAEPEGIKAVAETKYARICVYADPGVGKTRLIGTSPGKVLIIRPPTDHVDSLFPADRKRVKQWVISDWDGMNQALDYLRMEGGGWDWVWLDSASLMQDHLLDDLWETTIAEKPHRARYGLDKQEYGINMFRLGTWMRHMVGPDTFNFGFTAHPASLLPSEDPEEEKKLMPWIQGKNMSPKFCGYMNQVLFMEIAKIGEDPSRRVLRTHATERYYAKDQFDVDVSNHRVVVPGKGEGGMKKLIGLIEKQRGRPLGELPATNNRPVRRAVKPRRVKATTRR